MNVALMDMDQTLFPNLALMKLSAYHKAQGDSVALNFPLGAEKVYASAVFPDNAHRETLPPETVVGGTGFGLDTWLPQEIEHLMPDYSLYGIDYSIGFTSRGCIRHCPWCIVPNKEGGIRPWASIYEFWSPKHRRLWLLDNNLLASPNWRETLSDIAKEQVKVDFNQALDIRLVTDEVAFYLARCRYDSFLRFGFDRIAYEPYIRQGFAALQGVGFPLREIMVYILIGFDTFLEEDLERITIVYNYGASPFIMKYQPVNGIAPLVARDAAELRELARWVNQPHGFYKVMSFDEWQLMQCKVRKA